MPLISTNFFAGGPIKAADMMQFYQLFTGTMTDQPVTFANTLTIGGSQGISSAPLRVSSVASGTAQVVEVRTLPADVNPVFSISRSGTISLGAGAGSATDTTITRSGVNQLTVSGAVQVTTGGLQVLAGNAAIGTVVAPNAGLQVTGTLSGSTTQFGVLVTTTGNASATGEISAITARGGTAASAFVTGQVSAFHANNPLTGAGSAIQTAVGLDVDNMTAGTINNLGIYIAGLPAGGSGSNVGIHVGGVIAGAITAGVVINGNGLIIGGIPTGVTGVYGFTGQGNSLGGGAAATMGTIGGTGPTVSGQNHWLRINVGTTPGWIPVWV